MRKKIQRNAVTDHFREYSSIYMFVIVLFMMGVIFGAVVVNSLTFVQKEDLYFYLSQFFGQLAGGQMADAKELFNQSFFHNSQFVGLMWILGISVIGLPLILILLFLKGMVVGFTVGFLVNQMGWKGFLLSSMSILPQNFIIIPIYLMTAALAITISLKMIRRQFLKKVREPILPLFKRYFLYFVAALLLLLAAAGIEAYVSPGMMKFVITSIK
ncbi:stage II sporulation protein M [Bacillaceae bacterium Marseille-Q3522]|nr:stage II sporulation protein M [Bacillaceae bacterium Marseille-Q3522]